MHARRRSTGMALAECVTGDARRQGEDASLPGGTPVASAWQANDHALRVVCFREPYLPINLRFLSRYSQ